MEDVTTGWYGAEMPLCPSCRNLVVVRFDAANKGISVWGRNYAHVRLADEQKSMFPWPYQGFEARPNKDTFEYYRSMKRYIIGEAEATSDHRYPYIKATEDLLAPKPQYDVEPPKKKLTKKQQDEAERKKYQQTMLFADFPP